jgi:hypothetical protein
MGDEEPMGDEMGMDLDDPGMDMGDDLAGEEGEEAMMQEVARRVAYRLRKEGLETQGGNKYNVYSKKDPNTAALSTVSGAGLASKGGYSGKMFENEEQLGEDVEDLDEVELVDEDEIVNEVTRRVADRLRSLIKK